MKRSIEWFDDAMASAESYLGQRAVAGIFGTVVLIIGLLLLWLLVAVS